MAIILTAYPTSLEVTQGEHILEGGIRNYDVEFRLPENDTTWTGMALVGVFETDLGTWASFLDLESRSCKIPWEALDEGSAGSNLRIGLYGVKEDDPSLIVRSTVWAPMPFRILPGPDAEPSQDPSPSLFQQILSEVSKVVQKFPVIVAIEKKVIELYEKVTKMHTEVDENATIAKNSAAAAQTSAASAMNSAEASAAAQEKAEEAAASAEESKLVTLSAAREAVKAAAEAKAAAEETGTALAEATELLEDAQEAAEKAEELLQQASDADKYATLAKSWAVGETGAREGEDTDNSKYYAQQAGLSLEEMLEIVSEYRLGGGTAHVLDVIVPAQGWVASGLEDYPYQIDVPVEESEAEYYPDFTLDHDALDDAAEAGLCPTVEALDGIVRFWAEQIPAVDMPGVLALIRPGGEGSNSVDIATNEEVEDTIEEVFGSDIEFPDYDGSDGYSPDIATDEEVQDVIDDVFGEEIPGTGGSDDSDSFGYEVATKEEVAATIEGIFGD